MNWSATDVDKAQGRQKPGKVMRTTTAPSPVSPANLSRLKTQENPKPELPALPRPAYADTVTNSATWLFNGGRTSLSLARPHGRQRMAICGAPDEALVAVVLGAIQTFYASKP